MANENFIENYMTEELIIELLAFLRLSADDKSSVIPGLRIINQCV